MAIQLAHRMSKFLDKDVPVSRIFITKTIKSIVDNIFEHEVIKIPNTEQQKPKLSFAQERLWFIDKYEGGTSAYNVPISLELDTDTDIKALQKV